MKSFNEWLKSKIISENDPDYQEPSFSIVLGDDEGEPFSMEVYVDEGNWTSSGPFWAAEYVLDGSEPKAGTPVQENTGVLFKTPGNRLENLPQPIKASALAWVEKAVQKAIERYKEHDPSSDEDRPSGREWDDEDQAKYDRNLWRGGEDY
jgi:hypothetical protein